MAKHLSTVLAALALTAALTLPADGRAAEAKPKPPAEADLTGKVVAVTTKHGDKAGGVLEKVRLRRLGGRVFLVGEPIDDGRADNPYKGVKVAVWIPLEDVVELLEFDSVEEVIKVRARAAGRK